MPTSFERLLQCQRSIAAQNPSSYPILWPMLWLLDNIVNTVLISDLHQAESFCLRFLKSSWQGDPKVAIHEKVRRDGHDGKWGMSSQRKPRWVDFCTEKLNIAKEKITLICADDSGSSWDCSCPGMVEHDDDCLCPCQYCNTRRIFYCPCAKETQFLIKPTPSDVQPHESPERLFVCDEPG